MSRRRRVIQLETNADSATNSPRSIASAHSSDNEDDIMSSKESSINTKCSTTAQIDEYYSKFISEIDSLTECDLPAVTNDPGGGVSVTSVESEEDAQEDAGSGLQNEQDDKVKLIEFPSKPKTHWQHCPDQVSGCYYYWNKKTNEVTWDIPDDYSRYLLRRKEYDERVAKLENEGYKPLPKLNDKDKKSSKKHKRKHKENKTTINEEKKETANSDSNTTSMDDSKIITDIKKLKDPSGQDAIVLNTNKSSLVAYEADDDLNTSQESVSAESETKTSSSSACSIIKPVTFVKAGKLVLNSLEDKPTELTQNDNVNSSAVCIDEQKTDDQPECAEQTADSASLTNSLQIHKDAVDSANEFDNAPTPPADLTETVENAFAELEALARQTTNETENSIVASGDNVLTSENPPDDSILVQEQESEHFSDRTQHDIHDNIREELQAIEEKLSFICPHFNATDQYTILSIQLQTRKEDFYAGALQSGYFGDKLRECSTAVSHWEKTTAPAEWQCSWDSEASEYIFTHLITGEVQHELPTVVDSKQSPESNDLTSDEAPATVRTCVSAEGDSGEQLRTVHLTEENSNDVDTNADDAEIDNRAQSPVLEDMDVSLSPPPVSFYAVSAAPAIYSYEVDTQSKIGNNSLIGYDISDEEATPVQSPLPPDATNTNDSRTVLVDSAEIERKSSDYSSGAVISRPPQPPSEMSSPFILPQTQTQNKQNETTRDEPKDLPRAYQHDEHRHSKKKERRKRKTEGSSSTYRPKKSHYNEQMINKWRTKQNEAEQELQKKAKREKEIKDEIEKMKRQNIIKRSQKQDPKKDTKNMLDF